MMSRLDSRPDADEAMVSRQERDFLLLAQRMLRPLDADAVEPAPSDSDWAVIERACARCFAALQDGSYCIDLSKEEDADAVERAFSQHPEVCKIGRVSDPAVRCAAPLNLDGSLLYLTRYAYMEARAAAAIESIGKAALLAQRCAAAPQLVARVSSAEDILRIEDRDILSPMQARAGAVAATHGLTVLTGGPGTGKTTTVVRMLEVIRRLRAELGYEGEPLVRLAAPTGKAADRLTESVRSEARRSGWSPESVAFYDRLQAQTLDRLLKRRPSALDEYGLSTDDKLDGDVFVVDEVSMVSLSLFDKFLSSVPAGAQVILVGDPDQLAAVNAGTVLADMVRGLKARTRDKSVAKSFDVVDAELAQKWAATAEGIGNKKEWPVDEDDCANGLVELTVAHRFGGAIGELVGKVQGLGEMEAADREVATDELAASLVASANPSVSATSSLDADPSPFQQIIKHFASIEEMASRATGMDDASLDAMRKAVWHADALRLLCANKTGSAGSEAWNLRIADELQSRAGDVDRDIYGERVGAPIMVTRNNKALRIFNGDTGVLVKVDGRYVVCFKDKASADGNGVRMVARARIEEAAPAYAITIHKSQGSEFDHAIVQVADDPDSPLNTRELFYTGISRAKNKLTVVGLPACIKAALSHDITRASGLASRI